MTLSIALNYMGDAHLVELEKTFKQVDCKEIFVCGKSPKFSSDSYRIIGGYGIEFGSSLKELITQCKTSLLALLVKPSSLSLLAGFNEWLKSSENALSAFSYSSHQLGVKGQSELLSQPGIEYQDGSVRDDFDFGPLILLNVEKVKSLILKYPELLPDDASALYGLRLASCLDSRPYRFTSPSYIATSLQSEDAHQAHFAYASASGAGAQKALENVFTKYSKLAGFNLDKAGSAVDFNSENFGVEASIIIPVRNRAGKVEHAVESALGQITNFPFNVIVVDNHSSDGTTEALAKIAKNNSNLLHLIPESKDLGIGGCWQLAINHKDCGRFSVQLDSDDIYSSVNVLQRIVDEFKQSKAAAVVGSYLLVDRDLNEIPPGAIEHREWTDENGHNNALRINGFGAPRAYYTPVIRKVGFPNVSYGEDYSAMLAISREYKIARIYEHLYLCRRWEGNSDAAPSIEKMNGFHTYKDSVRTNEIEARRKLNR